MTKTLQRRVLDILNKHLIADRVGFQKLIDTRVVCDKAVLDVDTDVVVGSRGDDITIGPLGLINGILGEQFRICARYTDDLSELLCFFEDGAKR